MTCEDFLIASWDCWQPLSPWATVFGCRYLPQRSPQTVECSLWVCLGEGSFHDLGLSYQPGESHSRKSLVSCTKVFLLLPKIASQVKLPGIESTKMWPEADYDFQWKYCAYIGGSAVKLTWVGTPKKGIGALKKMPSVLEVVLGNILV